MANNYISDLTTPEAIQRIWEKGIIVDGYNASLYRQDFAGAWISREAYGDTDNILGWEIDHVYPEELGGGNHIENELEKQPQQRNRLSTLHRSCYFRREQEHIQRYSLYGKRRFTNYFTKTI